MSATDTLGSPRVPSARHCHGDARGTQEASVLNMTKRALAEPATGASSRPSSRQPSPRTMLSRPRPVAPRRRPAQAKGAKVRNTHGRCRARGSRLLLSGTPLPVRKRELRATKKKARFSPAPPGRAENEGIPGPMSRTRDDTPARKTSGSGPWFRIAPCAPAGWPSSLSNDGSTARGADTHLWPTAVAML